jgi:hypothetical protein
MRGEYRKPKNPRKPTGWVGFGLVPRYSDTPVLEYWNTGILEYWNTGILEYWSTGILEYWSTGVLEYSDSLVSLGSLSMISSVPIDNVQEREEDLLTGERVHHQEAVSRSQYRERYREIIGQEYRAGTISQESFPEWLRWLEEASDEQVDQSFHSYLPRYLEERRPLRVEREKILANWHIGMITDATLQSAVDSLRDTASFGMMDIRARWKLVDRIRAALAKAEGGEKYRELYAAAERKLTDAALSPQPALHHDKVGGWLKHIFEEYAKGRRWSFEQIEHFVKGTGRGTLSGYIEEWRAVAVEYWTLRDDPAFAGVRTNFVDTEGFLLKSFAGRKQYVSRMRREREEACSLKSRASALLLKFSAALDAGGPRRWMEEYLFNGNATLIDLRGIVSGELPRRLFAKLTVVNRYKDALQQIGQKGRAQHVIPFSVFISLPYSEQERKVRDLERQAGVTLHRDAFLRVRHHMELQEWDDAQRELAALRSRGNLTEDEARELLSMELMSRKRLGSPSRGKEEKAEEASNILSELREIVSGAPAEFQPVYARVLTWGNAYVHAYRWVWYNRVWCYDHNYLNPKIEYASLRRAKAETYHRHEIGRKRKGREVVHSHIEGRTADEPYVDASKYAPTNVHVNYSDGSSVAATLEWLRANYHDGRTLYWTNILPRVGGTFLSIDAHRDELARLTQLRSLSRRLEGMGLRFTLVGPPVSMN